MGENLEEKTVYLSGPITGNDDFKDDFGRAEQELKDRGWKKIISPCCLPANLDYEQYMTICFSMIDTADYIMLLNGWENSKGAVRELAYAKAKSKGVLHENDIPIAWSY